MQSSGPESVELVPAPEWDGEGVVGADNGEEGEEGEGEEDSAIDGWIDVPPAEATTTEQVGGEEEREGEKEGEEEGEKEKEREEEEDKEEGKEKEEEGGEPEEEEVAFEMKDVVFQPPIDQPAAFRGRHHNYDSLNLTALLSDIESRPHKITGPFPTAYEMSDLAPPKLPVNRTFSCPNPDADVKPQFMSETAMKLSQTIAAQREACQKRVAKLRMRRESRDSVESGQPRPANTLTEDSKSDSISSMFRLDDGDRAWKPIERRVTCHPVIGF